VILQRKICSTENQIKLSTLKSMLLETSQLSYLSLKKFSGEVQIPSKFSIYFLHKLLLKSIVIQLYAIDFEREQESRDRTTT